MNVDITAEVAARIGAAYGTTLAKGASVVASRDAHPASRMIKRAIISGLVSTGINVTDLRVSLPAVNRHEMRVDERTGGLHVRVAAGDPDTIQVVFFEPPGILASDADHQGDRAIVLAAGVPPHEPRRHRRRSRTRPGPRAATSRSSWARSTAT